MSSVWARSRRDLPAGRAAEAGHGAGECAGAGWRRQGGRIRIGGDHIVVLAEAEIASQTTLRPVSDRLVTRFGSMDHAGHQERVFTRRPASPARETPRAPPRGGANT